MVNQIHFTPCVSTIFAHLHKTAVFVTLSVLKQNIMATEHITVNHLHGSLQELYKTCDILFKSVHIQNRRR